MKAFLKKIIRAIYYLMIKLFPIRHNVIVFNSNIGRNYTGNPRALYEAVLSDRNYDKFKKVWFFNKEFFQSSNFAEHTKLIYADRNSKAVRYGFFKYHYYMAVAGIWIFDGRQESYLVKRKSVLYLQCWHGTPLKKLALDMDNFAMAEEKSIEEYKKNFIKETAAWDMLLSQNPFSTTTFKRCFGYNGEVLEYGYPRNDLLRRSRDEISKLKQKYNIPEDKKVILYAPTWRDNKSNGNGSYSFETECDFTRLEEKLNQDYILLVKYHYLVKAQKTTKENGFLRFIESDTDIADLYLLADMLVTDYSSVMFDYCILKRPMIFYMYDLENYRDELRGFYFDILEEAPGAIVRDTDTLAEAITLCTAKAYEDEYKERYDKFLENYAPHDDMNVSQKVLDRMREVYFSKLKP